jgi:quercetin dioxygenase-like cupin family protein
MRLLVAATFAACVSAAPALAAPETSILKSSLLAGHVAAAPAPAHAADGRTRVAMRKETLPPGGKLTEDRQSGERYLYVVSGRLKVSDLVTGDEQVVEAGRMAAEQPGDWHVAEVLGADPVVLYVIDRSPVPPAASGRGQ